LEAESWEKGMLETAKKKKRKYREEIRRDLAKEPNRN